MNARHIRTLRRLRPRAHVSVASRDADRAEAFAARVGAVAHFGSYEQAIGSAADAVVIGVPPRAHRQLVELALAADKHVLVEKPVFATFADLEALWPALKAHKRAVMVAENLHFAPFHRRLKALLRDGALGRPLLLDLVRLGRSRPAGWRADPAEMPLGALHEGGVHWIPAAARSGDGVRNWTGRPRRRRLRGRATRAGHRDAGRGHDDGRRAPPFGAAVALAAHVGSALALLAIRRIEAAARERRALLRRARRIRSS